MADSRIGERRRCKRNREKPGLLGRKKTDPGKAWPFFALKTHRIKTGMADSQGKGDHQSIQTLILDERREMARSRSRSKSNGNRQERGRNSPGN